MKAVVFVVVFACACATVALANIAPELTINLARRPERRWDNVVAEMVKDPVRLGNLAAFFPVVSQMYSLAGCNAECVTRLAAAYETKFPTYAREADGVAARLSAAGVPVTSAEFKAAQFLVEVFHAVPGFARRNSNNAVEQMGCSAIVTCDAEGRILHGRNLDFTTAPVFRNLTFRARFELGGFESLFETAQFIFDMGVTTGVRENRFSVSYNWRSAVLDIGDVLACAESPSSLAPLSSSLRELLEHGYSYNRAVATLSEGRLCAPMYLTLAAPENSAIVLTKGTEAGTVATDELDCRTNKTKWYVAKTNYDAESPSWDDRLTLATAALDELGQPLGSTMQQLFSVLSIPQTATTRGVLNELTIYSAIMTPADGTCPFEMRST